MKKKFLISFIIIIFLLAIMPVSLFLYERDNKISLIRDNVIIEYGNTYNPNIEELINVSKNSYINLKNIKIESNIKNEKDKHYPAVGEYEIQVYYKSKILKQKVEVIDTIAPVISFQDSIEIEYNTELSTFDFTKYLTASDLSELKKYNIDLSKVDANISGEYEAVISIEDIYGNKTEEKFKIIILENKTEQMPEEKTNTVVKQNNNSKKEDKTSGPTTNSNKKEETVDKNTTKQETTDNNTNKQDTIDNNIEKEEIIEDTNDTPKCTHSSENYYNSKAAAEATYNAEIKKWGEKWINDEIDDETYYKNCPDGYEVWTCPYCEKWTISFYY